LPAWALAALVGVVGFCFASFEPLGAIVCVGLIAVGLQLYVWMTQRSLLYLPDAGSRRPSENPPGLRSPEERDLPFREVYIRAADRVKIQMWWLHNPEATCSVIYFHGGAGNIGHNLPVIEGLFSKCKANVLAVEYRGFGVSVVFDDVTEEGLLKDAQAAHDWYRQQELNDLPLVLYGKGIGGAVAIGLMKNCLDQSVGVPGMASAHRPSALVVENAPCSMAEIVLSRFPLAKHVRPLLKPPLLFDEWRSERRLGDIGRSSQAPLVQFLCSGNDEVFPPMAHTKRLFRTAMYWMEDTVSLCEFTGGHDDIPIGSEAEKLWSSLNKFFGKVVDRGLPWLQQVHAAQLAQQAALDAALASERAKEKAGGKAERARAATPPGDAPGENGTAPSRLALFCSQCGEKFSNDSAKFCSQCGAKRGGG